MRLLSITIPPIFMDDLYTFTSSISSSHQTPPPDHVNLSQLVIGHQNQDQDQADYMSDVIKAQIANHPLYPTLLSAYIDCTKVGAPPEMASVLDEISKDISVTTNSSSSSQIAAAGTLIDPQLDHFMKSYCEALEKYKEELWKPFDEATNFLTTIKSQLTTLCKQTLPSSQSPPLDDDEEDCGGASSRQGGGGGGGGEEEVKEMLMRKYSGYLTSLRKEFLKKRKKGKLPKDAISALLDWWNQHYRWPYPTEEEKNRLSEMTGLDQKQINNWFINQRKRHWRPSEDMRFALMERIDAATYFDPQFN